MLRLIVSTRFQVLFHSPCRGSFHLSVTVLVRYRSPNVFSLGRWSSRIPTGFLVSRRTQVLHESLLDFIYGAVTLYGPTFQKVPLSSNFLTFILGALQPCCRSRQFGLFPVRSPLLGESLLISIPTGTEMFQFPALAPLSRRQPMKAAGFPHSGIFGSNACLPAHRSLSQAPTPFIAS